MKKIIFSVLFFCGILYVHNVSACCGFYYACTNQLNDLLNAVDEKFTINSKNDLSGDPLTIPLTPNSNGLVSTSAAWWQAPGVCFKTVSGECGVQPTKADAVALAYQDSVSYTYWVLQSIDWSGKGYRQKAGTTLSLAQYPNPPVDVASAKAAGNANAAQAAEFRWLKFLNFSGNFFRDVKIDGAGIDILLTSIDLSNNPTLQSLSVIGCPNVIVDITKNGFSFGKIFELADNGGFLGNDLNIVSWLHYGNQGIIKKAFAPSRIDLFNDADGFALPTTYTFTDKNGVSITPTKLGAGVFSLPASYLEQEVYCVAKCGYFTQLPDGITFLIYLVDPTCLSSVSITPKAPDAYATIPVQLKAAVYDFNYNPATDVTVKWESTGGTFDDDTSLNPKFTPTVGGNVTVKCTATQTLPGYAQRTAVDEITFNVKDAPIVTAMDVNFKLKTYLTTEKAPFVLTITDQYGVHTNLNEGVEVSASQGRVDLVNRIYTCSEPGYPVITFKYGGIEKTIDDLAIIENRPVYAWDAQASSEKDSNSNVQQLIDGNHNTGWAASQHDGDGIGPLTEANKATTPEWVIVDLGEPIDICMVEIDWEISRAAKWELQVSEDGANWGSWGSYDDALEPSVVNTTGSHYISRVVGQAKAQYLRLDCIERAPGYMSNYTWNSSIWEITAYAGSLIPGSVKSIAIQSGAYYNGEQLIIKGEGKTTSIYSVAGQKVLSSTGSAIDVSSLAKGCYIARITDKNGAVSTVKFIK